MPLLFLPLRYYYFDAICRFDDAAAAADALRRFSPLRRFIFIH